MCVSCTFAVVFAKRDLVGKKMRGEGRNRNRELGEITDGIYDQAGRSYFGLRGLMVEGNLPFKFGSKRARWLSRTDVRPDG